VPQPALEREDVVVPSDLGAEECGGAEETGGGDGVSSDYVVFDVGYGCESVPVVERFLHVVFVARVSFILVVFLKCRIRAWQRE